jgi:hypothetical protein
MGSRVAVSETPTGMPGEEEEDEIPPLGVPADAGEAAEDELPGLPDDEPDSAG